jgi:hypothetical protein
VDAARQAITEQLEQIDKQLGPYDALVETRQRLTAALSALDRSKTPKKRVKAHEVASYVAEHPGVMPAEIAAALEVPAQNVQAHLARNQGLMFERRGDGWHIIEGWETHSKDT